MHTYPYDLSLVIACYNEEPVLVDSVRQTVEILDSTHWTYEIIFVDDCSRDCTREIIQQLLITYRDRPFRRLFHEHNLGRGGTVTDGIRLAQGDVVGYIDIDLEVHARYIPSLVLAIQNGADVATAHRIYKVQWHLFNRFILSTGYIWLVRVLLHTPLKDTETGFKFFKRDSILPVLDQIEDQRWFWDTEVMVRSHLMGYKIVEIPSLFVRRYDKKSTVNDFRDSVTHFVKLWRFRRVVKQLRAADRPGPLAQPWDTANWRRQHE
jgi:glycosyltransferase involved in cell wall biosynthesis